MPPLCWVKRSLVRQQLEFGIPPLLVMREAVAALAPGQASHRSIAPKS